MHTEKRYIAVDGSAFTDIKECEEYEAEITETFEMLDELIILNQCKNKLDILDQIRTNPKLPFFTHVVLLFRDAYYIIINCKDNRLIHDKLRLLNDYCQHFNRAKIAERDGYFEAGDVIVYKKETGWQNVSAIKRFCEEIINEIQPK